jgi:hypothetical protein
LAENFKVIFEDFRHAYEADADHHHPAIVKFMELLFLLLDSIAASLAKAVAALSNPLAPTREHRHTPNPTPAKPRRTRTPAPRRLDAGWLDDPYPTTAIPAAPAVPEPVAPVEPPASRAHTAPQPTPIRRILDLDRTTHFRPPKRKFAAPIPQSVTPISLRYHNKISEKPRQAFFL